MTQEEKDLLLQDLCARLPYGIKFKADNEEYIRKIHYIKDEDVYVREYRNLSYWIGTIKPYLRPMSSMTEKEKREYNLTKTLSKVDYPTLESYDWLLAHHFDSHNLIEKGLAIEAPEGMYKLNKE